MANKLAPYKQPEVLVLVEEWWNDTSRTHPTFYPLGKRERTLRELHVEYTQWICDDEHTEKGIIGYVDFGRALRMLGIKNLSTMDRSPEYYRLKDWAPSLDNVARYQPPERGDE